mgnify:CR=1 FL=1
MFKNVLGWIILGAALGTGYAVGTRAAEFFIDSSVEKLKKLKAEREKEEEQQKEKDNK